MSAKKSKSIRRGRRRAFVAQFTAQNTFAQLASLGVARREELIALIADPDQREVVRKGLAPYLELIEGRVQTDEDREQVKLEHDHGWAQENASDAARTGGGTSQNPPGYEAG